MEELAVANAMPCLQYGSKALMSVLCRVCRNIHLLCALCPSRVCCKRVSSFVTDARAHETKATTAPRTARSRRRRRRTSVRRYPRSLAAHYSPAPRTPPHRLVARPPPRRATGELPISCELKKMNALPTDRKHQVVLIPRELSIIGTPYTPSPPSGETRVTRPPLYMQLHPFG